jgi:hypothetical protein
MKTRSICGLLAVCVVSVLFAMPGAFARGGGGGGRGGGGGGRGGGGGGGRGGQGRTPGRPEMPEVKMRWLGGLEEAAGASEGKLPILLYLRRAGDAAEQRDERTLFSNASVKQGSHNKFAALRLDALMEDGAGAVKKYRVKRDGALVWLDGHLNRIRVHDGGATARNVLDTLRDWPYLIRKFERELDRALTQARMQVFRDRHGPALDVLLKCREVNGPKGDKLRELLARVEQSGTKLIDAVERLAHGKRTQAMLLRAIAFEFKGTKVEARAKERIKAIFRQTTQAAAKVAGGGPGAAPPPAGTSGTPEAPGGPAAAPSGEPLGEPSDEPSIEEMTRVIASRSRTEGAAAKDQPAGATTPPKTAEAAAQTSPEAEELYQLAKKRYQKGYAVYYKAMKRGPEAKPEFVRAFGILTEALEIAEKAFALAPKSGRIERLIEQIGMARYGCFKHQAL